MKLVILTFLLSLFLAPVFGQYQNLKIELDDSVWEENFNLKDIFTKLTVIKQDNGNIVAQKIYPKTSPLEKVVYFFVGDKLAIYTIYFRKNKPTILELCDIYGDCKTLGNKSQLNYWEKNGIVLFSYQSLDNQLVVYRTDNQVTSKK